MDGIALGLYVAATFLGGFTSGLTGFAAGLVVSGVWLHVITPLQTAMLIAAYGVVNQSYGIWKVRHALRWRRVLPFVLGGRGSGAGSVVAGGVQASTGFWAPAMTISM